MDWLCALPVASVSKFTLRVELCDVSTGPWDRTLTHLVAQDGLKPGNVYPPRVRQVDFVVQPVKSEAGFGGELLHEFYCSGLLIVGTSVQDLHASALPHRFQLYLAHIGGLALANEITGGLSDITILNEVGCAYEELPVPAVSRLFEETR